MFFNVHSVTHLSEDYLKWSSSENVSCFHFESYLGSIIKRLTGRNKVLEQICNEFSLENSKTDSTIVKNSVKKLYFEGVVFGVAKEVLKESRCILK